MTDNTADLLEQALKLPPAARAALADSLVDSLDEQADQDAEKTWGVEIARRIEELNSGVVQSVPWVEARRQLRARLDR
jgi:putative addiction module component (TIGR02574 family)